MKGFFLDIVSTLRTYVEGDKGVLPQGDTQGRLRVVADVNTGGSIVINGVSYPIKRAVISGATNGDNQLVALVASKKIRVISCFFVADGEVDGTFQSDATPISGAMPFTQFSGLVLPKNDDGWFETAAGAKLDLFLSAAVQVSGALNYIEV